jgi:probable HAF family extracellular repeat protein
MFKAKSIFISLCAVLAVLCFAFTADAAKGGGGCKDRDNDGYFQKEGCGSEVDCDDSDATVNPSAAEVCDGIDNNCDGTVDEGCGGCTDNDGDVYGDGTGCLGPDCDDADSSINPGASEVCDDNVDNNCDGTVDEGCGGCEPTTNKEKGCDCFDNADNDCDGSTDSLDRDCKRQTCDTCFDNDSDGWYTCGGDCDDSNPAINPSAPEVCNGIDDNCDELLPIEEQDVDWDGVSICEGDCDDNNPNKSPNNTEEPFGSPICTDGIDNDCDNLIDAVDPGCEIPCIDNDGDGYGANGNPSCLFPFEIDCNDNDPAINQGAMEVPYDGIDQDCNGSDLTDADRDGFDADIIGGTDCNDSNALIYPGAIEGPYGDLTCCDTVDNNCDGTIDEIDPGCLDGGGEAAKCEYKIIDLGTLSGSWSKAFGINNQGQIVGLTGTTNGDRAFLYENGVMTNLGTLGGTYSVAYDVNNYDQVVGYSFTATSGATAYIYENGSMTDLGVGGSFAFGINDSGQIVGQTFSNDHAFLYVNGVTTDLGTLGGTISRGYEINNVGQIAGVSRDVNDFNRAFLYENGVMSDLGTLGGDYSVAFDINDNGQIVGYSPNSSGSTRAFLYESGVMNDIGTLTGAGISYAHAINNSGKIVGWSSSFNSYTRAFVYDNGSMAELGTLGGRHSWAEDINDTGEIVGWAYMNDNVYHAVMWTPDADNDGYYSDEDCDDTDPNINPEALEGPVGDPTCADGLDNDCDGNSDSFDSDCVLPNCDIDGDGYCGSCSDGTCISGDCDDTDPLVNPVVGFSG